MHSNDGVSVPAPAQQWHGLTSDEVDQAVGSLVDYGTEFVAPLYAVIEGVERKLQERNAGVGACVPAAERIAAIRTQLAELMTAVKAGNGPEVERITDAYFNPKDGVKEGDDAQQ